MDYFNWSHPKGPMATVTIYKVASFVGALKTVQLFNSAEAQNDSNVSIERVISHNFERSI
eukprot:106893-Amphidinium_carterae.1